MKSIQLLDRLRKGNLLTETARQLKSKDIRSPLLIPKCTKRIRLALNTREQVRLDIHGKPSSALHMCKSTVWESALPKCAVANGMQQVPNDWEMSMTRKLVHALQVQNDGLAESTLL